MGRSHTSARSRVRGLFLAAALLAGGAIISWWLLEERRAPRQAGPPGPTDLPPVSPNVLVITIDTLRADHLSSYGSKVVSTPNIDRLASEGLRFSRAISHVPLTLPSHASLFTGMDPLSHGVHNNGTFVLDERFATLAEVMKAHGYRTGAFVGAFPVDSRFGIDRGFEVYNDQLPPTTIIMAERPAPEVLEPAVAWLEEQGEDRWFCWIHLYEPHFPYQPPPPFDERFASNPYAGEVAYVDQVLGEFFEFLREQGLYDNTWIVFTSDHGEGRGDHQENTHGTFTYHSTLWVPLIFRYPVAFRASTVVEERVRLIDIMPTVLDYLGLPVMEEVQGESLRPLITGSGDWDPKPVYFESMALTLNYNWASPRGIYAGKHKYIDLPLPELYDIEADFDETRNLWELEPELASSLRKRFHEHLDAHSRSHSTTVKPQAVDQETLEKLRALGYVGGGYHASVSPESTFGEEDDPKRLIHFINQLEDARTFFQVGRHEDAIELYQRLIDWRPDFALAYASLAEVYEELGRLSEAIEVLETACQLAVRSDMVLVRLGTYLREVGQLERSEAVLKSALESYPDHVGVHNSLGMTYYSQGRAEEAIRIFNELLRGDPSLVSAHSHLGTVYLGQQRYDLAMAQFQHVLELDPRAAEALNGMGVVYVSTGRPEQAIQAWKDAVATDAHRFDTLLNLGMLLTQQKRFGEATKYLEQFVETAPLPRYEKDVVMVRKLLSRLRSAS